MNKNVTLTVLAVLTITFCLVGCAPHSVLLQPTGRSVALSDPSELTFSQYISKQRDLIRTALDDASAAPGHIPFLGGYTNQEAAAMRAPFQIPENDRDVCSDSAKGGEKGFLLIHGLTDSPYLMRGMADSLHRAYPCARIRAVLLPGHGTVPGDTLKMTHEEWLQITDYGVRSFEKEPAIRDVYLIGFSTGTALALRQVQEKRNSGKVKGLVLLSPAVRAKSSLIRLSGLVGTFSDWESIFPERDAARYESFSYHAAAEFYQLTKDLTDGTYKLDIPLLMAVSADDATIDAPAARKFFCDAANSERRALIWYRSRFTEDKTAPSCSGIAEVELKDMDRQYEGTRYRFANMSHIAIPISPGDRHYGVSGVYRNCKSYDGIGNPADFTNCQSGSPRSVFGENSIGTAEAKLALGYDYWRRSTFNPDYDRLEKSIICFVDNACSMDSVLDLSK